jgi:hypothetical protein
MPQHDTTKSQPLRRVIKTNEDEARWLADTIQMRAQEAVSALGVFQVDMKPLNDSLYQLLLLSLNAATKRGKEHTS